MKKRLISMMLAIATAVSFTACSGVEANTSRTSSVESSSITESTESTTLTATDSKADATTTASSESEVSSTTTTNSSNEDTTTESTSSTSPKEEKIEERDVYDEDGNVVDKIKVKVVDGVTYTIGENVEDGKFITGEVPLICNDKKYPSGEAYAASVIMLKFFGVKENVTQDDIAELLPYCGDDAWYVGNDGRNYGPSVGSCLIFNPTKNNESGYNNASTVNISYVCEKFFEDNANYDVDLFKTTGIDYANVEAVKKFISQNNLLIINAYLKELPNKLEWYMNFGNYNVLYSVNETYYFGVMIGYEEDNYYSYDPASNEIIRMNFKSKPLTEIFSI